MPAELNIVTGAFGYTGKYITQRLLARGKKVRTLTGHPNAPNPFGEQVRASPFDFDRPSALTDSLRGAATLYNTYWVRFCHSDTTYQRAVENTQTLIQAMRAAGVRRIVHISITHPTEDSPLPYFRGKALVERMIMESGLTYAIIRPTVIFGPEDILINNIAWLLRRVPVFAIPGSGDYRLQPVFVEDVADLAVRSGEKDDNVIIDAVGPEVYTFEELVRLIAGHVAGRARILHLPSWCALMLARAIGMLVGDVVLTREELDGLMSNLLISAGRPTGKTHFSEWLGDRAGRLGKRYASELSRHYR